MKILLFYTSVIFLLVGCQQQLPTYWTLVERTTDQMTNSTGFFVRAYSLNELPNGSNRRQIGINVSCDGGVGFFSEAMIFDTENVRCGGSDCEEVQSIRVKFDEQQPKRYVFRKTRPNQIWLDVSTAPPRTAPPRQPTTTGNSAELIESIFRRAHDLSDSARYIDQVIARMDERRALIDEFLNQMQFSSKMFAEVGMANAGGYKGIAEFNLASFTDVYSTCPKSGSGSDDETELDGTKSPDANNK